LQICLSSVFYKNISEIFFGREFGALSHLRNQAGGSFSAAGHNAQAVYAQQDTAGYGPVRGNGSRPTGARSGAYVRVRTPTRQSQRVLHSFWDIGERPVGGRVKEKAPSWVLGACTQREAVGGDSPPGMLSVNPRLAVSEKDVQYYLFRSFPRISQPSQPRVNSICRLAGGISGGLKVPWERILRIPSASAENRNGGMP